MRWWTRKRLIGVAVIAVVALGVGVYAVLAADRYGEQISGPTGTYPEPVGTGAPANPSQVLTLVDDPWIVDGLAVQREPGTGLVASDLRTGDQYWSYGRDGHTTARVSTTGGVVHVLWDDGLLVQLDPRTGEPNWHARTDLDRFSEIRVAETVVAVADRPTITAYDLRDGEEVWTVPVPDGCEAAGATNAVLAVGHSIVAETWCESDERAVLRVGADGNETWMEVEPGMDLRHAGDGRFAIVEPHDQTTIYSADTGEVSMVFTDTEDTATYYRGGNGDVLVAYSPLAVDDGDIVYSAWNVTDDAPAWTVLTDGTWRGQGSIHIYDDVAYALRTEHGQDGYRVLVVYDAASGDELSRVSIDLDEHLTAYGAQDTVLDHTELRVQFVRAGEGTVTVTIAEPDLMRRGCDILCIVLAEP
ncbi:PQQ-binding-like beta-propeller repeat protein [Phytoactinopolyspora limicola]|uniref:outer membrane protein assembly factor BamB family protein n=1 Tax=Phytoactinopolyspora limicola TaxID=2715536 RepID=UPI00140CFCA5|nr:PQQ-binding-like beta-propeller repeat protein [Phytoactinopolyspora limicola]